MREYRSLKSHKVEQGMIHAIIPMTLAATEVWDPNKLITDSKILIDGIQVEVIAQKMQEGYRCVLTVPVVPVRSYGGKDWSNQHKTFIQPKDPVIQQLVEERKS